MRYLNLCRLKNAVKFELKSEAASRGCETGYRPDDINFTSKTVKFGGENRRNAQILPLLPHFGKAKFDAFKFK